MQANATSDYPPAAESESSLTSTFCSLEAYLWHPKRDLLLAWPQGCHVLQAIVQEVRRIPMEVMTKAFPCLQGFWSAARVALRPYVPLSEPLRTASDLKAEQPYDGPIGLVKDRAPLKAVH